MNSDKKKTDPITKEDEVQKNPDPKIDQDFPGFPHAPSSDKLVKPSTDEEKKSAGVKKNNQ